MTNPSSNNSKNDKSNSWAIAVHLSALLGLLSVPFGNILGPLFIWLIKRKEFPTITPHAFSALNFQLSLTLYGVIAGLLIFIYIGFFLLAFIVIFNLFMIIKAATAASNGIIYHYPLTIRFIK